MSCDALSCTTAPSSPIKPIFTKYIYGPRLSPELRMNSINWEIIKLPARIYDNLLIMMRASGAKIV
jgi:hypothetical protein